ncbi:type III-A CRISPR-associated protein Cas10/Csm1 [Thermovibrio sp.]
MSDYYLCVDVSGIQDFVYRVYDSEGGLAKTLRARSLYVELLTDSIKEKIKEAIGKAEILDGGGSLTVKLSLTEEEKKTFEEELKKILEEIREELEGILAGEKKLQGGLGVVFSSLSPSMEEMISSLELEKRRKFSFYLSNEKNFCIFNADPGEDNKKVVLCPVCRLNLYKEEKNSNNESDSQRRCDFCLELKKVGAKLSKGLRLIKEKEGYFKSYLPFEFSLKEVEGEEEQKGVKEVVVPVLKGNLESLINSNPEIRKKISPNLYGEILGNRENFKKGMVAPFEIIALESEGDLKLGYLVMDVDNLGLFFSNKEIDFEIKRLVSELLNEFFKKEVSEIARTNFSPFESSLLDKTLIYILYAGGDDLFAIGPWNKVIEFALVVNKRFECFKFYMASKLRQKFKERNSLKEALDKVNNFTLSAGISFVKPKLTVRVAANWAKEEEARAKNGGKNAVGLFGEVISWCDLDKVLSKAEYWAGKIKNGEVPRRLFYRLYNLYKTYVESETGGEPYKFFPYAYYFIARNLESDVLKQLLINDIEHFLKTDDKKEENKESEQKSLGFKTYFNYILMKTRG